MTTDLLADDQTMTDAGGARNRSRRRLWLLGLVIFIAGIAVGAAGMVGVQTWRFKQMQKHFDPTDMPRQIAKALQREVQLSDEQTERLVPIIKQHFEAIEQVRREVHPRFQQEVDIMDDAIRAELDDEQRERYESWRINVRQKMFPPPSPKATE